MSDPVLQRHPPPPIPFTVLTGFLGAGKTTLLNRLLADPALSDALILINEFGEIGLDHLFVEKVEGDMLLMSSGCLCCTIRGDLIATLEDALRNRDNGRVKPFTRVIVETTGLADPAPVLHTIMHHPYLMLRFRLQGVVTVVDAINGAATLDAQEEAVKQVAVSDRIVLTKTDLAAAPDAQRAVEDLRARLKALAPSAKIIEAADTRAENLLDAGLFGFEGKIPDVARWLNDEALAEQEAHGHAHDHHAHDGHAHGHHDHNHAAEKPHAHRHDPNRHDARIRAFCLTSDRFMPPQTFDLFIDMLRNVHGPNMLRVKGLLGLSDDPARPVAIHGVQHVFHPPVRLESWPDGQALTRIVFILRDLDPAHVKGLWAAFLGESVDAADGAARANNPLKPRAGGLLS
ncbi:MAG: GTP-binding protein [Beijerinckiaceae bacterium]|nr:GTP-binding protein [Beijerinckiaceae bacterium]